MISLEPMETFRDRVAKKLELEHPEKLTFLSSKKKQIPFTDLKSHELVFVRDDIVTDFPPGPKPYPFVKNIPDLVPNLSMNLLRLVKKYGPVFPISFPAVDLVMISDPQLIQLVYSRPEIYIKVFFHD